MMHSYSRVTTSLNIREISKCFVVAVLSIVFAFSLVFQFNLAFAMMAAVIYLVISLKTEQAIIKLFLFIYLFLTGLADKYYFPLYGNEGINFLGIINLMLILTLYLKLWSYLHIKKELLDKNALYPVFIFSIVLISITPFSKDIATTIRGLNRILSAMSFYLLTYFLIVKNKHSEKSLFQFVYTIFIILSTYGIIEYVTNFNILKGISILYPVFKGSDDAIANFRRIRTTFMHPSIYAFYIMTFLPLAIYFLTKNKKKVYLYGFLLLSLNLILTFTRIAWIAVAIQVMFSLFLFKSKRVFGFCLLLIPICIVLSGQIVSRLIIDSSVEGRPQLFLFGLSMFKNHPLFGCGLGTYVKLSSSYFGEEIAAHCDYVKMFAETGVLGGISYFILIVSILVFAVKNMKNSDYAKISFLTIIGFVIFSMTDNGLAYSHVFWALIGLYNGLIIKDKYEKGVLNMAKIS